MPEIVIKSKITAPRLHDKIIHRDRLTKLLDEHINKNLIIICAPAGFGKTTLIIDYLQNQKIQGAWIGIPNRGIDDVSTFFEYLINSLKNINNSFGSATLEIMKSFLQDPKLSKELVQVVTASFVNEFIKFFKEDIIIVIDDLHYIDSERSLKWLNEFFNELLENIPVNMHLFIISRRMPDINLTSLKAKRNLYTISEKALNFDNSETSQLLEQVYNYKHDSEDIKLLEENLKGWVTGIHLLLQAYGEDFNKTKLSGEIAKENIFDFFAHEIFENQSKEIQEFLLTTSLLENFDAKICDVILDIKNSQEIINELVHKNLFIHQSHLLNMNKDHKHSYTYHALLKNYLNNKLKELKKEEEIKSLMIKIAEYYLNLGDKILAINYFLEVKEVERAVPLMIESFDTMNNKGKWSTLWKWLSDVPDNVKKNNPYLLFFLGRLSNVYLGNYEKSLVYFNDSLSLTKFTQNEDLTVGCTMQMAILLSDLGKTEQAIAKLKEIFREDLRPKNKATVLYSLGYIYGNACQSMESIRMLNQALSICNAHKIKEFKPHIYNILGINYFNIAEVMNSILYFEKALDEGESISLKTVVITNLIAIYSQIGDFSKAFECVKKASQTSEIYPSNNWKSQLFVKKMVLLTDLGDYETSIGLIRELYYSSEVRINKNVMLKSILEASKNYRYINNKNLAFLYLRRAQEHTSDETDKNICDVLEAVLLTENKLNQFVEDKLLNAYKYFNLFTIRIDEMETAFYLSNYYFINNLIENSLKYLKSSLKIACEANLSAFFQNELLASRTIFDFALANPELKLYKDFIKQLFAGVFDRINLEWTSDEYKKKMKIQVETLYDIKMTSFGSLEFVSRGEPVADSKWRKKKGKSMLAYMMLNPDGRYNKDKLIDIFFQDINPETVEESFRQAVFNIRSVFKNPYLNILLYEGKMLQLNPDCYYKSDAAEFDKNYNSARSPEKSAEEKIKACKNAIELYKGEFLEGNYEPWCEDIRNEYGNKFITISELLLNLLLEKQSFEEIIEYSENLLKHDKLNESAYVSLIHVYKKLNKIKSARDIYSKMLKAYKDELGEKPNSKIVSTIQNLLEN